MIDFQTRITEIRTTNTKMWSSALDSVSLLESSNDRTIDLLAALIDCVNTSKHCIDNGGFKEIEPYISRMDRIIKQLGLCIPINNSETFSESFKQYLVQYHKMCLGEK